MKTIQILTAFLAMTAAIDTANAQTGEKKILVAWYSWGGNTETIGQYIQELTGADVFIIEPEEAYSTVYNKCTEEAQAEINAGRQRPIKGSVENIAGYDVVVIGTPNWWSTMAPPVLSFLKQHELSGKTILPFVTHGGGGQARCFSDMQAAAPQARFLTGLAVAGNRARNSRSEVEKWLKQAGIL